MDAASGPPPLEVEGLSKSFGIGLLGRKVRPALNSLTLTLVQGEILGYLGPNGSGKTTTLKLLMGLVKPDSGSAAIFGRPLSDGSWKSRVGYLPEHPYFYDYLTPEEYLDYMGCLCGLAPEVRRDRARELIGRVGLGRAFRLPMRRFSKGMSQRVGLAQALLSDPDLVFLDEPMSGLDPVGRRLVRDLILELKRRGKTVFFSTHILSDAETLCDRVALLRGGVLLKVGRLDEILQADPGHLEVLVSGGDVSALAGLAGVELKETLGERRRFEVGEGALVPALQGATAAGARVLSVQPARQSLEDYFVKEMGEPVATGEGGEWVLEE